MAARELPHITLQRFKELEHLLLAHLAIAELLFYVMLERVDLIVEGQLRIAQRDRPVVVLFVVLHLELGRKLLQPLAGRIARRQGRGAFTNEAARVRHYSGSSPSRSTKPRPS